MGRLSVRPRARKRKPVLFDIGTGIGSAGKALKGLDSFIELLSDMEKKGETKAERTGEINLRGGKDV